jgi:hypothetical protein
MTWNAGSLLVLSRTERRLFSFFPLNSQKRGGPSSKCCWFFDK